MALSIKILDCNGACRACYERPARKCQSSPGYDIEAIMATLGRELAKVTPQDNKDNVPCLHGGEPLLIALPDLRRIMEAVFRIYGRTGIQTNAVLIDEAHLALFQEFKTHVGISLDGDAPDLNRGRWNEDHISPTVAADMTEAALYNIGRCRRKDIPVSIIAVLRKYNAAPNRLERFKCFLLRLRNDFGIFSVRTNECIVYDPAHKDEEELTSAELGQAFLSLADLCFSDSRHDWRPYRDIVYALRGETGRLTCVFNGCDPWRTEAERTICADGSIGGCLKTGAGPDGIQALAAPSRVLTRNETLIQIPQDEGGCADCEWWGMCHGGCPGAGVANDWRNRTRFCVAWKELYAYVKGRVSGLMPDFAFKDYSTKTSGVDGNRNHGDSHGDQHGDAPHGDHNDRR